MRKEDKQIVVDNLTAQLDEYSHFYVTDIAGFNAEQTSNLRRECFKKDIKLIVVKNTLLKRALEAKGGDFDELYPILKGSTSVMFSNTGNAPAKLIKELRKSGEKPVLKAAFVEESIYVGDDQVDALTTIKSKEELVGDVIGLLQSPAKNVISALSSGGSLLHGLLKTLGEKED